MLGAERQPRKGGPALNQAVWRRRGPCVMPALGPSRTPPGRFAGGGPDAG